MPRLLILTAVLPEAQAIARALDLQIDQPSDDVQLSLVGVRATRLPAVQNLSAILLAGLAGGISPALKIGDIVIDGVLNSFKPSFKFTAGSIHSATKIISTPAEKRSLYEKSGCVAVDMETGPVRQFAQVHNAPVLIIRAISDGADDHLDPAMLTLVDELGRPKIGRAMGMIVRKPTRLKAMLRLKKATDVALANLAIAVKEIVESGWPGKKENATR